MRRLRLKALEPDNGFFTFVVEFWAEDGWRPLDVTLSVPKGGYGTPAAGSTVVIYPDEWNEGDIW